jgi:hypothetical protein
MNFFHFGLLKLRFIADGSIGRKSYIADQQCLSILAGKGWKAKIYEITKLQTISCRDRHRRFRLILVGLQRIRAAGAVAGHDDNDKR